MTEIPLPTQRRFNMLEAEGQLNKDIQIALQSFRQKLTENIEMCVPEGDIKKYETTKQGPEKTFAFRESLLSLMF